MIKTNLFLLLFVLLAGTSCNRQQHFISDDAFRAEVALGVRSPQEIAARRGRDYDEVVDEIAEAKTKAESKGLGFGDIFTAPGGLDAKK